MVFLHLLQCQVEHQGISPIANIPSQDTPALSRVSVVSIARTTLTLHESTMVHYNKDHNSRTEVERRDFALQRNSNYADCVLVNDDRQSLIDFSKSAGCPLALPITSCYSTFTTLIARLMCFDPGIIYTMSTLQAAPAMNFQASQKVPSAVHTHYKFRCQLVDFEGVDLLLNSSSLGSSGWPPPGMGSHSQYMALPNGTTQCIYFYCEYNAFELTTACELANMELPLPLQQFLVTVLMRNLSSFFRVDVNELQQLSQCAFSFSLPGYFTRFVSDSWAHLAVHIINIFLFTSAILKCSCHTVDYLLAKAIAVVLHNQAVKTSGIGLVLTIGFSAGLHGWALPFTTVLQFFIFLAQLRGVQHTLVARDIQNTPWHLNYNHMLYNLPKLKELFLHPAP